MNKQFFNTYLAQLGLENIEAQIYLYLLENGARTPLELSRELNVDRSKIYRYAEKLIKKKLIEESNTSWGKKLKAANPQNILLSLAEKEEQLKIQKKSLPQVIDNLMKLPTYSEREFEVKHYRGQEGLKQMLWNQLSAKKEIIAFSYKNKNDIVGKSYAEKIRAEQVERKIMLYEVENETDQGNYWYTNIFGWKNFYKSRHIPTRTLKIKQYIAIFNNTVAIINWSKGDEIGIEIINASFTEMQKQLFWKFWGIAGKK